MIKEIFLEEVWLCLISYWSMQAVILLPYFSVLALFYSLDPKLTKSVHMSTASTLYCLQNLISMNWNGPLERLDCRKKGWHMTTESSCWLQVFLLFSLAMVSYCTIVPLHPNIYVTFMLILLLYTIVCKYI